jgi:hypothetical protein
VRPGQYWRLESLKSFDEFLARRFRIEKEGVLSDVYPRVSAAAGEKDLTEVGWTNGLELAKVARRDKQHLDCATWLHKGRSMPREDFRRQAGKELIGKEMVSSELICFKVYKSQISGDRGGDRDGSPNPSNELQSNDVTKGNTPLYIRNFSVTNTPSRCVASAPSTRPIKSFSTSV